MMKTATSWIYDDDGGEGLNPQHPDHLTGKWHLSTSICTVTAAVKAALPLTFEIGPEMVNPFLNAPLRSQLGNEPKVHSTAEDAISLTGLLIMKAMAMSTTLTARAGQTIQIDVFANIARLWLDPMLYPVR